ncbi:MAG: hypothetical protein KKA54_16105 [Proteobacteria bacterium]|nr:hypothetical protein [Pseudomonadota bacterium]
MKSHISVPVQTSQFLELANFLRTNNDPRDPVDVIVTAIDYWLDNASWKPELLSEISSDDRGYQWKSLFLVHGTQIRMQYKGTFFYAKVEGDEIIYNGESISPGSMVNKITGTSRNAWRDLWIKRPSDQEWKSALGCRPESKEISEKLLQELDEFE